MADDASRYAYTVHLRLVVEGPGVAWDILAERAATRVQGLALKGGYLVVLAEVDEARMGIDD